MDAILTRRGGGSELARLTYTNYGEIIKVDNPTPLSQGCYFLAATSVGNYALFGGGYDSGRSNAVNAYESPSLVKKLDVDALSVARDNLAATAVGNYALFGGGAIPGGVYMTGSNAVDAYESSSLVKKPDVDVLSVGRMLLAATSVGNYALFGGGDDGGTNYSIAVDAYESSSLAKKPDVDALSLGRTSLAATSVGNYALFGGGAIGYGAGNGSSAVDAYESSSLAKKPDVDVLSAKVSSLAATGVGSYALFGGGALDGGGTSPASDAVDAYESSSLAKKPDVDALSVARYFLVATSVSNYALFGGGNSWSILCDAVDVYYSSLVKKPDVNALSVARDNLAATAVGSYALFGGGSNDWW
jgi:hypothetical protein